MFLKSLQIQGFKSFPDKVKLDFKQGITATVGPNGSGKSNISDAVRWVLGEQAPSALRIKSMEDVIFDGTNARKAAGFAEVIITIDNTRRWLSPDTDEVTVGRRYYRSGSSEYRINGKSALLREVNELFMDTGIGKDGYSMIGQGKISDIVDSKAHDRRVIFEEAAGISKYRYRKHEAEKNLQKTQDNLTHLDVILAGLEERVGPLEKESEKAKKYLELRDKYKSAEIGLWLTTLNKTTDVLRDQSYKLTSLDNQRAALDEQIQTLEEEADALYIQSGELASRKDECLRKASEMDENALRLEGEAAVLDNDIRRDREDIERLGEELRRMASADDELAQTIEQKKAEREELVNKAKAQEEQISLYRQRIDSLRSDESGQGAELTRLQEEQNRLTIALSEHRMSAAGAKLQLDELTTRGESIGQLIAETQSEGELLRRDEKETKQAIEAATDKANSLGNTLSGYRMRLDKQRSKAEEAKQKLDLMRLDAQDKKRRANNIEELERSMEGYDFSVRKVMQRAEAGGLRGIHCPVSRAISVDMKYAAAVETALGAAAKNIIVDNENDGKQAVEFLKQNRSGRATFLPISVIRPRRLEENGLSDCPGYVNIASRLVNCDPRYRDIIDNLLGKVCVVDNMDSAIAIGRKYKNRFRIVTLDGQVINAGGSMTGGSLDKNIGLLSRKGELTRLREQAAELEEDAKEQARILAELQQKAAADEASLIAAQSELTCANEDRVKFEAELRLITGRLTQNTQQLESLLTERDGMAERIARLQEEISSAAEGAEKCESELSAISARIAENSGAMDKLTREREELAEALSQAGMEHLSMIKESQAAQERIDELTERMKQGDQRGDEVRIRISEIEEHIAALTQQAAELRDSAKKLREGAKSTRDGIADIQRRRDEMELEIRSKRKESRETSEQREAVSSERGKLEARMEQTQRDHDSIITRMMEEYNITRREAAERYEPAENEREAQRTVSELKGKIRALGSVNVGAIEEYKEVSEKYNTYKTQMDDVIRSKTELEKLIEELTVTMQQMFRDTFDKINKNFGEIFPELFGGGSARMTLVDDEDCLNCGIDIEITPPGKERRSIMGMSGGEKSIIAVAIYFAIMKVKPSPFCFLDEIDHALDEHNVNNIAQYIKRFVSSTQYVVITHRRGMMEAASMLYGVTKQDGISKLISLSLDEIEEKIGKLD